MGIGINFLPKGCFALLSVLSDSVLTLIVAAATLLPAALIAGHIILLASVAACHSLPPPAAACQTANVHRYVHCSTSIYGPGIAMCRRASGSMQSSLAERQRETNRHVMRNRAAAAGVLAL